MPYSSQQYAHIYYFGKEQNETIIQNCSTKIKAGEVVIIPTDTVYGISADYFNLSARDKIIKIKQRPINKSFIILLPTIQSLLNFADQNIPENILNLLPAPLTLVVKNKHAHLYGENNIAIRIPTSRWLINLLMQTGVPLISTSANISGDDLNSDDNQLISQFGSRVSIIVLKNAMPTIQPSTILDISQKTYQLLRQGEFIVPHGLLQ